MGTAAISMYSAEHGAQMVRVHDVKETKQVLDMYYGIVRRFSVFCIPVIGKTGHRSGRAYKLLTKAADMNFPIAIEYEYLFVDA